MTVIRVGGNKSQKINFPTIRPTLDLNFANTRTLDPRISFRRSSGGSYFGADGYIKYAGLNEARFDHDPETRESLGILIEESRTNLLTNSNFLGSAISSSGNSVEVTFDPSIIAPDGSRTAQKAKVADAQLGAFAQSSTIIVNSSTSTVTYCWSVFVKKGTTSIYDGLLGGINTGRIQYNFDTDTLVLLSGAIGGGRIIYPNGWVRIFGIVDVRSGQAFRFLPNFFQSSIDIVGSNKFTYQWGSQVEEGRFPTSYIPTTTTARTRNVDIPQIIGNNFTNFYNEKESTIYTEAIGINDNVINATRRYWEISNNTTTFAQNAILSGYRYLNSVRLFAILKRDEMADIQQINTNFNLKFVKSASSFKNNYYSLYSNGSISDQNQYIQSRLFGKLPVVNQLYIGGSLSSSGVTLNGTVRRLIYWPKILPDEQLRSLTR
jgi:hypothetical protein